MANDMRDRLVELIQNAVDGCARHWAEIIADHLVENGVVVPPYDVGQRVYVITSQTSNGKNLYIFTDIITHYHLYNLGHMVMCFDNHLGEHNWNWDNVFLTKAEAEQKLKEMRGE